MQRPPHFSENLESIFIVIQEFLLIQGRNLTRQQRALLSLKLKKLRNVIYKRQICVNLHLWKVRGQEIATETLQLLSLTTPRQITDEKLKTTGMVTNKVNQEQSLLFCDALVKRIIKLRELQQYVPGLVNHNTVTIIHIYSCMSI